MRKEFDERTELLIDLLIGALNEEGYETKRISDITGMNTTAYDGIEVKGNDGDTYFSISVNKKEDYVHPYTRKFIPKSSVFDY